MENQSLFAQSASDFPDDHSFNGIDVVKLIGAFLVIMIHIPPFPKDFPDLFGFSMNYWVSQCLSRIAVPFYFTSAGFLLFRKIDFQNFDTSRTRNYCLKILRLFGTWIFLIFCGWTMHLWYLPALVLAVLVLSFLFKRNVPFGIIGLISILLFLIGLFGDLYYGFLEPLRQYALPQFLIDGYDAAFQTTRNGIFFGMVFVWMGALFAKKRIVMSRAAAWIGFILSEAAMFFEAWLVRQYSQPKDYNMHFFLLPAVFFLFYLASHANWKNKPVYGHLRGISVLVYLGHTLVNFLVMGMNDLAAYYLQFEFSSLCFIIVAVITTLLAILIERLSRTKRFNWLKYLYQ